MMPTTRQQKYHNRNQPNLVLLRFTNQLTRLHSLATVEVDKEAPHGHMMSHGFFWSVMKMHAVRILYLFGALGSREK